MKYLKRFNEAVIKPYDFDKALEIVKNTNDLTIDKLNSIFQEFGVEFVDVEYFKSKLQTKKEIDLVPIDLDLIGGVRFAAHNIYTNMMYVCVIEDKFLSSLKTMKDDILTFLREVLRHESIHKQQGEKRDVIIRNLENSPMVPKKYFGSTDEIMAYAQSFIDQCHQDRISDNDILNIIKTGLPKVSWIQNVYSKMEPSVKNRFNKYVYQYLQPEEE